MKLIKCRQIKHGCFLLIDDECRGIGFDLIAWLSFFYPFPISNYTDFVELYKAISTTAAGENWMTGIPVHSDWIIRMYILQPLFASNHLAEACLLYRRMRIMRMDAVYWRDCGSLRIKLDVLANLL